MNERLIRAALEDGLDDDLIHEIAESAELQADVVNLIATFTALPGEGARDAEVRLEALLDAVAHAAVPVLVAQQQVVPAK